MADYRWLASFLVLACLTTSGCASFAENLAAAFSSKGEEELDFGVRAYEDGELAYSAKLLQASLDGGLRGTSNRVRAHKYLAFIHCASGRVQQCRDEFKKALDIDPSFDLRESEAGHPTWGPVFRSVKAKK
jgi:Tfp pilus assembly protein PilF